MKDKKEKEPSIAKTCIPDLDTKVIKGISHLNPNSRPTLPNSRINKYRNDWRLVDSVISPNIHKDIAFQRYYSDRNQGTGVLRT